MTNLFANWDQILKFAKEYGLPADQSRAIIREYLQAKIISLVYSQKSSRRLFFVGGTSLRLLYGLDRFSEDLDFDSPNLDSKEIKNLLTFAAQSLERENFNLDFYENQTSQKNYYEFRFHNLSGDEEKLVIKFDFESFWKKQTVETVTFNRYGFLANVTTKTLGQFVVEKLVAYLNRKETLARDLYDLVWLASQNAEADGQFAKFNGFEVEDLINKAKLKFEAENVESLEARLDKFLLNPTSQGKISFFDKLY